MLPVKRPAGGESNAVHNRADCYAENGSGLCIVTTPELESGEFEITIHE